MKTRASKEKKGLCCDVTTNGPSSSLSVTHVCYAVWVRHVFTVEVESCSTSCLLQFREMIVEGPSSFTKKREKRDLCPWLFSLLTDFSDLISFWLFSRKALTCQNVVWLIWWTTETKLTLLDMLHLFSNNCVLTQSWLSLSGFFAQFDFFFCEIILNYKRCSFCSLNGCRCWWHQLETREVDSSPLRCCSFRSWLVSSLFVPRKRKECWWRRWEASMTDMTEMTATLVCACFPHFLLLERKSRTGSFVKQEKKLHFDILSVMKEVTWDGFFFLKEVLCDSICVKSHKVLWWLKRKALFRLPTKEVLRAVIHSSCLVLLLVLQCRWTVETVPSFAVCLETFLSHTHFHVIAHLIACFELMLLLFPVKGVFSSLFSLLFSKLRRLLGSRERLEYWLSKARDFPVKIGT